ARAPPGASRAGWPPWPCSAGGFGGAAWPSRPHRHQGADHVAGALEDAARVVVGKRVERFVQRAPAAGGDPLVRLGHRVAIARLEQEEVAVLVDVPAAEAEVPVDDADRALEDQIGEA